MASRAPEREKAVGVSALWSPVAFGEHDGALDAELIRSALITGLGSSGVVVDDARLDPPRWMPGPTWASRLTLTARGSAAAVAEPVIVEVAVPVDDDAATTADGHSIGGHRGTFLGRARVPGRSFTRLPGVRFVAWTLGGRTRVALDLQSPFGATWRIELREGSRRPWVRLRSRAASDAARWRGFHLDLTPRAPQTLDLWDYLEAQGVRGVIADRAELLAHVGRLPEHARRLAESGGELATGDVVRTSMDPRNWRAESYPETLVRAAAVAGRRTAAAIAAAERVSDGARTLILSSVLQSELDSVAAGERSYSATPVRTGANTLTRLELAREISFLGPSGLEGVNGRVDLRVLPETWRGTLCPVQTPESVRVGLVRYAALAEAAKEVGLEQYDDVSVAAALVPFLGHDDPTRTAIGAKMLKQALVLDDPEPPVVRTGAEVALAEVAGVVRAPIAGRVRMPAVGVVTIDDQLVRFGPPSGGGSGQAGEWRVLVRDGDVVDAGAPIALAPDVFWDAERDEGVLQLGRNVRAALLAWHGWNYEDGIVVSRSLADRLGSTHRHVAEVAVTDTDDVQELLSAAQLGSPLGAETAVLRVLHSDGTVEEVIAPAGSVVHAHAEGMNAYDSYVTRGDGSASVAYELVRSLQIGDKLTTRHSGKGVVTRIEPDDAMPRAADGLPIEVLLNPLGVLRRLNVGTVFELNEGLAAWIEAAGGDPEPRIVPRVLGAEGRAALAARLSALGAPGGRLPLVLGDGSPIGPDEGVTVGLLYLLKVDHLAVDKAGVRSDGGGSPATFQPARSAGRRGEKHAGAPQRLGEMEYWGLLAAGADAVLAEVLQVRGVADRALRGTGAPSAGMRAARAHLAVAGIHVDAVESRLALRRVDEPGTHGSVSLDDLIDLAEDDVATAAGVNPTRAAARVIELWWDAHRALGPTEGETSRFHLDLSAPVAHPWSLPGAELPALTSVALLPPAAFLGRPDPARGDDPMRVAYERVIAAELRHRRSIADDRGDANGRLAGQTAERVVGLLGTVDGTETDSIAARLRGKFGILRRNLMGSTAIRSARAVIVGDPGLDPETVVLPRWMLDGLGVPDRSPTGYEDVVLFNRQPTLHPYALVALRAIVGDDDAVRISPALLQAIAGDFDGDTAAVHRPTTESARDVLWKRLRPAANLRSGASGRLLMKRDLDVALGLALEGQSVGAAAVDVLAEGIVARAGDPRSALDGLTEMMRDGLEAAAGWAFSLVDMPAHDGRVLDELLDDPAYRDIRLAFDSGAGGKHGDLSQLLDARGEVRSPDAATRPRHVASRYLDGIDHADYFAVAQPAIGGLAAKKLLTPFAGALTKYLVELAFEVRLHGDDCGAGAGHSVLACRDGAVCRAGYGPDRETGDAVADGRRVGILAGMLIGEKSTQLAMKSIHQRGDDRGLASDISELQGVFGGGGFHLAGERTRLSTLFAEADDPVAAMAPVLERYTTLLGDQVDPIHAQIVLRPLVQAARRLKSRGERVTVGALRADVRSGRSALSRASQNGDLAELVRAIATGSGREVLGEPADDVARSGVLWGSIDA